MHSDIITSKIQNHSRTLISLYKRNIVQTSVEFVSMVSLPWLLWSLLIGDIYRAVCKIFTDFDCSLTAIYCMYTYLVNIYVLNM